MAVGAGPNMSGGLWIDGMSGSMMGMGNGNARVGPGTAIAGPGTAIVGQSNTCGSSPGGGDGGGGSWGPGGGGSGGSSGGGGGSCSNPGSGGGGGASVFDSGGGGAPGSGGPGGSSGPGVGPGNFLRNTGYSYLLGGGLLMSGDASYTSGGGFLAGGGYQDFGMGQLDSSGGGGIFVMDSGSTSPTDPCSPPPGSETPIAVSNPSGAGSSISVGAGGRDSHGTDQGANGIPITCAQTGLTLNAVGCSATFFVPATMITYSFSAQGGTYLSCTPPENGYLFGSGSDSGLPGSQVGIVVTVT